jgi:hypothetical protein
MTHPETGCVLDVLRDLMLGGRHSRRTVSKAERVSLPTADRWLTALLVNVPGVRKARVGKTTWYEWIAPRSGGRGPGGYH